MHKKKYSSSAEHAYGHEAEDGKMKSLEEPLRRRPRQPPQYCS